MMLGRKKWLMVKTGWEREADCEGIASVGDVVQTSLRALAAASRLDPSLENFVSYYDRAEQLFTGQLYEQRFREDTCRRLSRSRSRSASRNMWSRN